MQTQFIDIQVFSLLCLFNEEEGENKLKSEFFFGLGQIRPNFILSIPRLLLPASSPTSMYYYCCCRRILSSWNRVMFVVLLFSTPLFLDSRGGKFWQIWEKKRFPILCIIYVLIVPPRARFSEALRENNNNAGKNKRALIIFLSCGQMHQQHIAGEKDKLILFDWLLIVRLRQDGNWGLKWNKRSSCQCYKLTYVRKHKKQNFSIIRKTRQESSMIHSASAVVNIDFAWNLLCFPRFWKVRTDGQHVRKQWSLPAGRDCGSTEWIKRNT